MAGGGGKGGAAMVCVAQAGAAHGVRGAFRLRCFTEAPGNVAAYGPLCDAQGNELFEVRIVGAARDGVIAKVDGIDDRDAAETLRGRRFYVPRARLPEPGEDEFYHEDLVGLAARDRAGRTVGRVLAVLNFGAGDILEIETEDGRREMVPFTRDAVPTVDLAARTVEVVLPAGSTRP
ncbi:MAG TPA: ribosome maturation factor RimM [Geminicoccaceae bacterium]|nr:ribosome maturation factor RimM [Geminicoccaceae bacterium]